MFLLVRTKGLTFKLKLKFKITKLINPKLVTTQLIVLSSSMLFYDLRLLLGSLDDLWLASMGGPGSEGFESILKYLYACSDDDFRPVRMFELGPKGFGYISALLHNKIEF